MDFQYIPSLFLKKCRLSSNQIAEFAKKSARLFFEPAVIHATIGSKLIALKKLPVTEVPKIESELFECWRANAITYAQYSAAIKAIKSL